MLYKQLEADIHVLATDTMTKHKHLPSQTG
jgi:hypothetical protein